MCFTRMKLYGDLGTLDALHRSASHITNAKQSNPQERPFTEALEGSQVTVQRPPSVQGLLYILGGHPRLIASRLIPLQDGAEVVCSNPFIAGRSRA